MGAVCSCKRTYMWVRVPTAPCELHTPDLMLSRTTESVEPNQVSNQPSLNCNQVNLIRRNPSYEASSLNGLNQETQSYKRTKTLPGLHAATPSVREDISEV